MVATYISLFVCLKAMSFFDWDPEKKIKRGREKSQAGGEKKSLPCVSSSFTAVRRKDWKFKPTGAALQE